MTAPKSRSNGERLAAARAAIPRIERERDAVMASRRECLLNDDDAGRRRRDRRLRELRDDLQAAHDKAELLGRAGPVAPEQQPSGWTWPTTLADVTAALLEVGPEIVRMQAVPRVDRSAVFDAHLEFLIKRHYSLSKLKMSMQPKVMVAT